MKIFLHCSYDKFCIDGFRHHWDHDSFLGANSGFHQIHITACLHSATVDAYSPATSCTYCVHPATVSTAGHVDDGFMFCVKSY